MAGATNKANKMTIRPTAYAVKKLYGNRKPFMGWGDFKHKLVAHGIIATPNDDVPAEWQAAFRKACGR